MYNLNNKLNEQQRLNIICSKLVNKLMKDGKKTISKKIVYDTFRNLEKTHNVDPHHTLLIAIENVSPFIEVRSIRLGGTKHPVPVPVKPKRQIGLALK
jgi:small subunit ribosomal protein S7